MSDRAKEVIEKQKTRSSIKFRCDTCDRCDESSNHNSKKTIQRRNLSHPASHLNPTKCDIGVVCHTWTLFGVTAGVTARKSIFALNAVFAKGVTPVTPVTPKNEEGGRFLNSLPVA